MWGRAFRHLFYTNIFATCDLVMFSRTAALSVFVCAEACFSPLIYFCQMLQLWVCVLSSPTCEQRPCLAEDLCPGLILPPNEIWCRCSEIAEVFLAMKYFLESLDSNHAWVLKVCLCEFGAERLRQRCAFTRCRWRSTKLYCLEVELRNSPIGE